ncbi:GNAT family N-acetyltransferase [Halomonas aestuarii]|uniref:GNAT family N-acetyltransferase n=1 Tax=Halomonas aestuarii TaxID=1897729 RepID=UPI001AD7F61F|nr:GNAT family N-acetyltransferase [Halomonas aestuarii]
MTITIEQASRDAQFRAGAELFREYARHLGLDLGFQGFEEELGQVAEMYGPPAGALLLARDGETCVGVVGLREFAPGDAEMKRMYVMPSHHGQGVGHALALAFLETARGLGYRRVLLDSLASLEPALALYRRLGFTETAPYRYNPFPDAVFMEYRL